MSFEKTPMMVNNFFIRKKYMEKKILNTGNHSSEEQHPTTCISGENEQTEVLHEDAIDCKVWEPLTPVEQGQHVYLKDYMDALPEGFLYKERTGVGATTLELTSKRNSIIVVPTRELASQKTISCGKIGDKYKVCYCGGSYKEFNYAGRGFSKESVDEYLHNEAIEYKKFVVVSDSVPRLLDMLEKLGEDVYSSYFFAVDEIDCYQNDSSFRPNMAKAIDCYWRFAKDKRCMLSATAKIESFSDPRISKERKNVIEFPDTTDRGKILLYPTNDPITFAKEKIVDFWKKKRSTEEKLVVALNKVTYISNIIEALPEEIRKECGVMCSKDADSGDTIMEQSMSAGDKNKTMIQGGETDEESDSEAAARIKLEQEKIKNETTSQRKIEKLEKHYGLELLCDLKDGYLDRRIVFMTCSFYVGIDIKERFYLMQVASTRYAYTMFTVENLIQIQGRCRHNDGLLGNCLVYDTYESHKMMILRKEEPFPAEIDEYQSDVRKHLANMTNYIIKREEIKDMPEEFVKCLPRYHAAFDGDKYAQKDIISRSNCTMDRSSIAPLVRFDLNNDLVANYFNSDNIVKEATLINYFYNREKSQTLVKELEKNNFRPEIIKTKPIAGDDSIIGGEQTQKATEAITAENWELIKDACFEQYSITRSQKIAGLGRLKDNPDCNLLIQAIGKMMPLVDPDKLKAKMDEEMSTDNRKWKSNILKLTYRTLFWALSDDNAEKKDVMTLFPVGKTFSSEQIGNTMKVLGRKWKLDGQLKKAHHTIFAKWQQTTVSGNKLYRVVSYNACEWEGEPKQRTDNICNKKFYEALAFGIDDLPGLLTP